MADVIVNAEVRSNVGQLNQDLRQTQQEAISIKDAFGVASGSIAAVQGGMKLFGVESEKTQEAILKVQAAMSMNQGIQSLIKQKDTIMSIAGFIGKWTGATKVLTVAQKLLNIVMSANPIGLVIAGITALIGLGAAIVSFFKNNAAATKEETEALKQNNKEILANMKERDKQQDKESAEAKHRLELMALRDMTIHQYYKELEAIRLTDLERERSNRDQARADRKAAQVKLDELKRNNDTDSEIVKNQRKHRDELLQQERNYQKEIDKLKEEGDKNRRNKELDREKQTIENEKRRVQYEIDQEKKRQQRALRVKKERISANKQFLSQLRKMNQDAALLEIEDDQERELKKAEQEKDNQLKALEKSKVGPKVRAAMIEAIELEHQNKMKEINDKFEEEAKEKREEENALLQEMINENNDALIENEVDQQIKALERQKEADLEKLKLHANFNELKLELDKKYDREIQKIQDEQVENDIKAKKELVKTSLKSSADLMKQASEFAGDNKELAAGSSLINTYQAVTKTLADGGGSPLSYLMAAGVLAAGLKSVQSIYDTDVGSGGGGGSTPPAEVTPAPQMVSGSFDLTNVQEPEPLKAFVVTDEMTSSQDQLANIRRRATI
jgi:hypothetical protein